MYKILSGVPKIHRRQSAALHFDAFADKIGGILGRDGRGENFFAEIIDSEFGICAVSNDESKLYGVAGFKTTEGSLIDGSLDDIQKFYGRLGGFWRGIALSFLERKIEPDRLLMDGIAVIPEMRGQGIGSALLNAIVKEARDRGKSQVRLDVIVNNPKARALYERAGFIAEKSQSLGPLKFVFGFKSATTMVKPCDCGTAAN